MTFIPKNILVLFLAWTFTLFSCRHKSRTDFSIQKIDTVIHPLKISIDDLAKDYKALHGHYIETEGNFFSGFEQFSIYTDKELSSSYSNGFWLNINNDIQFDYEHLSQIQGKKIKIKGIVDTTQRGHLSMYLATITNIYFWEER
jgi:hypothetical protein